MFHSNSNFYWTALLFKLAAIPFLLLLLLLLISQAVLMQHMPSPIERTDFQYPSDIY